VAKKTMSITTTNDDNGDFEVSLLRAVRSAGWLLPTSEAAVEEDEGSTGDDTCALPEELSDPLSALDPSRKRRVAPTLTVPKRAVDVDESLARAAREGNEKEAISREVEDRMRSDKERARSEGE